MSYDGSRSPTPPMPPMATEPAPATEGAADALASLSASEGAAIRALLSASMEAHNQQDAVNEANSYEQPATVWQETPVRVPLFGAPPLQQQHSSVQISPGRSPTPPPRQVRFVGRSLEAHRDNAYPVGPHPGAIMRPKPSFDHPTYGSISVLGKRPGLDALPAATMSNFPGTQHNSSQKSAAAKAGTKRARYDDDFKEQVVREAMRCPEGARIKPTCSRYPGVEPCQLRKWIQKFAPLQQQPQQQAAVWRAVA